MAVVGGGNTPMGGGRKGLSLYAGFERTKGGLLYVAQAACVLLALLARWFLGPAHAWLAVLVVGAVYGSYFAIRWPLWKALYRRGGHLEHEGILKQARDQVWVVAFLAFVLPLGLAFSQQYSGPLWPLLGSSVVVAAIVIAFGRLPVDGPILTLVTITVSDIWRLAYGDDTLRSMPAVWVAFVVGLAVWGLIEHSSWSSSDGGPASDGTRKEDVP